MHLQKVEKEQKKQKQSRIVARKKTLESCFALLYTGDQSFGAKIPLTSFS